MKYLKKHSSNTAFYGLHSRNNKNYLMKIRKADQKKMSQSDAAWHDVIWLSVSISLAHLNVINSKKKFHNFEVEEDMWYCSSSNEKSSTTIYSEYAPTATIQAVQQGTIDPIRSQIINHQFLQEIRKMKS